MLSIRNFKIVLAIIGFAIVFTHNSILQLYAILALIAVSYRYLGELRKILFWIIYGFITFLPWFILRSAEALQLSCLLFLRSTLLYLALVVLAANINITQMHYYLPRLLGEHFAMLLTLALNLVSTVRHIIIRNYGIYYFKNCNACPKLKRLWGYVLIVFKQVIFAAENCAENMIMAHKASTPHLIIITGSKHSGKTTKLLSLIGEYQAKNWPVSGIVAPGLMQNNRRTTIYIKNIKTNKQQLFASRDLQIEDSVHEYGGFRFSQKAYSFAKNALLNYTNGGIVVFDEYGPLEFAGMGFADAFTHLLSSDISTLVVVIRKELLPRWLARFSPKDYTLIKVEESLVQDELEQTPILSQS